MNADTITPFTPVLLRFYARCFSFPYAEQQYELHHLFRTMEKESVSLDDNEHLEMVLNIINHYQGQEIKILREDYISTFTNTYSAHDYCPLIATDFVALVKISYDAEPLQDEFAENGIAPDADEPYDSIINYLEYFSLLCEQYLAADIEIDIVREFLIKHVLNWIPVFCRRVEKLSTTGFYRDTAAGLRHFLLWLRQ
jgi:TorA maturation chaperone TorD